MRLHPQRVPTLIALGIAWGAIIALVMAFATSHS